MPKSVYLVTGMPAAAQLFSQPEFRDYKLTKTLSTKEEAAKAIVEDAPDIALIIEGTPSSSGLTTYQMIRGIHKDAPDVRIVFVAGEVSPADAAKCIELGDLVQAGIYDIIIGRSLSAKQVLKVFSEPMKFEDVKYLVTYSNKADLNKDEEIIENLICVDSVKPGSGKTLLAVNMAVAIAKYGQKKRNGNPPRVAIIDGDLNSLSVGTMLHMESMKYNLREALRLAGTVIDRDGNITGTDEQIQSVKTNIRRCFIKHAKYPNLYALVSTNIPVAELDTIHPAQFYFLLKCVHGAFDVVIVDMNSSLEHRTTGPLFALSKRCYFLLDPDYNNIKNNLRYNRDLEKLGIKGKIKYVMNRYISPEMMQTQFIEDLDYPIDTIDSFNIDITNTIPMADGTVLSNRAFKGTQVVTDANPAMHDIKKALLRIANENWKIDYKAVKEDEDAEREANKGLINIPIFKKN